jgi:hypothetical protein
LLLALTELYSPETTTINESKMKIKTIGITTMFQRIAAKTNDNDKPIMLSSHLSWILKSLKLKVIINGTLE